MNYQQKAKDARLKVLSMIHKAGTSHIGSNFSVIDILTVLFEKADLTKDKILLSAGWKAASFYYFLAEKGLIPKEELDTYCQPGSRLIGLTEPGVPGVHFAGGSMQCGLPAAVGFALSKKLKGEEGKVYCVMSDGELAGGMIWESLLIAKHHKLDNLVVIIDNNGLQAMGKTKDILGTTMSLETVFSWGLGIAIIQGFDGHDYEALERAIVNSIFTKNGPLLIIANTTKGKGVSFMEGNNEWHYRNIPEAEYNQAVKELNER